MVAILCITTVLMMTALMLLLIAVSVMVVQAMSTDYLEGNEEDVSDEDELYPDVFS
jgi:hypothetical protein